MTNKLNFKFLINFENLNLNLSSHMGLLVTILDSAALVCLSTLVPNLQGRGED